MSTELILLLNGFDKFFCECIKILSTINIALIGFGILGFSFGLEKLMTRHFSEKDEFYKRYYQRIFRKKEKELSGKFLQCLKLSIISLIFITFSILLKFILFVTSILTIISFAITLTSLILSLIIINEFRKISEYPKKAMKEYGEGDIEKFVGISIK